MYWFDNDIYFCITESFVVVKRFQYSTHIKFNLKKIKDETMRRLLIYVFEIR